MSAHPKGTVKYNIQLHPDIIDTLKSCTALTGHPTANVLATDLIQLGLEYLTADHGKIPPALEALRRSIADPRAPKSPALAALPGNQIAATLARHTRQIAELTKALQTAPRKSGKAKKKSRAK